MVAQHSACMYNTERHRSVTTGTLSVRTVPGRWQGHLCEVSVTDLTEQLNKITIKEDGKVVPVLNNSGT
jgi:hypothetical protein